MIVKNFSVLFVVLWSINLGAAQPLPLYFQYDSQSINSLKGQSSNEQMSIKELAKLDAFVDETTEKAPPLGSNNYRLNGYLLTAQREAAFLSYNTHGKFMGSLGPVTAAVLNLFYEKPVDYPSDEYSKALAQVVMSKLEPRYTNEKNQIRNFPTDVDDPRLKYLAAPHFGMEIASWQPWILYNPREYKAPRPPAQNDPFWKQQGLVVKEAVDNATDKQKQRCKFWAGEAGHGSGSWLIITNDYMLKNHVSFPKMLFVRSVVAQAGIDVDIALFNSKYTYLIQRPSTVNPEITEIVELPHHPSYPSGHSTLSSMYATVLTSYFPENKAAWLAEAEEAGKSRIWAGLHFPIDHQQGWILGNRMATAMLQSSCICWPEAQ